VCDKNATPTGLIAYGEYGFYKHAAPYGAGAVSLSNTCGLEAT